MKLADLSTGPDWTVWIAFTILIILSVVLISGHGSWLISGYNTASQEEKAKYNEKKLCRIIGIGIFVIAILLLIMVLLENIALGIVLIDIVAIIISCNKACKK